MDTFSLSLFIFLTEGFITVEWRSVGGANYHYAYQTFHDDQRHPSDYPFPLLANLSFDSLSASVLKKFL